MEGLSVSGQSGHSSSSRLSSILVIDPGWRNLGVFLLEIDYENEKLEYKYETIDLEMKKTSSPEEIIDSLDNNLIPFLNGLTEIHLLVIEKQPHNRLANKILETTIQSYVKIRLNVWKIYPLSAIQVKRFLGLPILTDEHRQNKLNMIKKIREDEDLLFGGEDCDDHIADCIGLLNTFLGSHKRIHKLVIYYKEKNNK